ncbi:bifunctional folylpolyglutamate synthase/dihydrofolate synthase [Quadrisphaera sp. KR29]|uniref:bifunctional folylpolyglutamate synthase/dihydrofolate synthase n=1 Tax=Quadrisphaera sp. KR29 TaxID=3461391 RepID=UPI004043EEB5
MSRVEGGSPERSAQHAEERRAAAERLRAVHAELLARTPEGSVQPRLEPVREVLELLGDPQRAYPVIHLTGTNGKTSTSRFAERLLREMGLRTGRFTSPHLSSVTERISIDGEPVSDEVFVAAHEDVAPYLAMVDGRLRQAGQVPLTYFEVLAVLAFAAFADAPVDVAVVEVGVGGEWDATNAADATVAVVTPISLDHTDLLGDTVEEIAETKAGIFTPDCAVVLAQQPVEAAQVLLRRAVEVGATVAREGLEFGVRSRVVAVGGQVLELQGVGGTVYSDVLLTAFGEHQGHNAAVALAAVEAFLGGQGLEPDLVRAAFADVTTPGRLEVVRRSPVVLVDAAHNPGGAQSLVAALEDSFEYTRLVGVVAVLDGKDALGILEVLEPVLDEVVVTRSSSARAMEVDDLADIALDVFGGDLGERVHVAARLDEALQVAVDRSESEAPGGLGAGVLVTGSITLVGDARTLLRAPAAR